MKTTLRVQAALILAVLLSAGWAQADESAPPAVVDTSEIQLKNGASMRGTIVAVEPGQRVIVIVAGEQSVIPWNDVAKIVGGPKESNPAVPPPVATAPAIIPAPAAVASAAPSRGMPFIHVESDWPEEVELQRIDGEIGGGIYTSKNQIGPQTLSHYVCVTPCDKLVDGREGHRFFFSAPGMYPSQQFRLESQSGYLTARVHGVGVGRMVGGLLSVTSGGIFLLGGGMLFGFSFLSSNPTPANPNPDQGAGVIRTTGIVLGGLGAGLTGLGIYLLSGGRTRVELIKNDHGETALALDRGVFRF